jgi:hypothetical protein
MMGREEAVERLRRRLFVVGRERARCHRRYRFGVPALAGGMDLGKHCGPAQ